MRVAEEVVLRNHEPRSVEEVYRGLVGEKELCTDLAYFERIGSDVVFASRREMGPDVKAWKDDVLVLPVATILAAVAA
jgi:hypothetical protein